MVLGIIASLSTLLQQDYPSGLRVIESLDYLIPIGIGFGIDNVKQIIAKFLPRLGN